MDLKQTANRLKKRLTKLDWKGVIATKSFITVGCLVLVCVAVAIGSLVNTGSSLAADAETSENRVLGNTILVDAQSSSAENSSASESTEPPKDAPNDTANALQEDFFAMAILNRTQVRDSALEVLREIADNPDALPDAKEEALSSIAAIADDMSAEANIETLIEAKGISKCVAVISGDSCSVIVNKSDLLAEELTRITDIVFEQTGIPVSNITVVEAQ